MKKLFMFITLCVTLYSSEIVIAGKYTDLIGKEYILFTEVSEDYYLMYDVSKERFFTIREHEILRKYKLVKDDETEN